MKVVSLKPRGSRMFKCVNLIHNNKKHKRPFFIEPIGKDWWFCLEKGQWENEYNGVGGMSSSYYSMTIDGYNNAYSLKAVKRLVAKWDVPKGTKFRARLPYAGYEFHLTK